MLLFLAGCSEYGINSQIEALTQEVDNSATVKDVIQCIYTDHSGLIPDSADDDGNLSADDLAAEAAKLASIQQEIQTKLPSLLARHGYSTTDLENGQVAAHLVILAHQNENFSDGGEYGFLLVFGETTDNLESFTGSSLTTMASQLSLDAIYARADVADSDDPEDFTANLECGVVDEGVMTEIDMLYVGDDETGVIHTIDSVAIPLYPDDNESIADEMYANTFQIAETSVREITNPDNSTLETPDLHVLEVVPLNQHLLESSESDEAEESSTSEDSVELIESSEEDGCEDVPESFNDTMDYPEESY